MTSRALAAILVPLALSAVIAAGCTGGPAATPAGSTAASAAGSASAAPSAAGAASISAAASASAAPSASAPATAGTSLPGTTETDWGTIWDALPPRFPAFPGAQPTETGAGPASAILQLPGRADVAADWWKEALGGAGYQLEAVNGPLEDGSIVVDATGEADCRVQAVIAPLGDATIATIFVGASCPFE